MSIYIGLKRPDPSHPWGFRIQGGVDFYQDLKIASVTPNSLAECYGIKSGDRILKIGGDSSHQMTHQQVQQAIIRCGNELSLEVVRGAHTALSQTKLVMNFSPNANHNGSPRTLTAIPPISTYWSSVSQGGSGSSPRSPSSTCGFFDSPSQTKRKQQPSSNFISPSLKLALDPQTKFHTPQSFSPLNSKPLSSWDSSHQDHVPYRLGSNTNSPNFSSFAPTSTVAKPVVSIKKPTGNSEPRFGRAGEHVIAKANSKPVCYHCKIDIRGPYLAALEYCFCPCHFNCSMCNGDLLNQEFVEQNESFYCHNCFSSSLAPRCSACFQPIVETVVTALDKKWHSNCFACAHCQKQLGDSIFRVGDDNKYYCDEHWKQLFQIKCDKCLKPIEEIDRFLEAFGKNFHAQCFVCAACQCPLEGKPFHRREGKAFCKAHAHAIALF